MLEFKYQKPLYIENNSERIADLFRKAKRAK